MSMSKPAEFLDIQDSMSWNYKVVHEDLLCGIKVKISEELVKKVLNAVAVVMFGHANVVGLLEYMMKRNLLTETEVWQLSREKAPKEKALELHQILMRKGVDGFFAFYVCLIESYMMQDGLESHYALIKSIERKVRTCCGIKPEILMLDAVSIGAKLRKLFTSPEQAKKLLRKLNAGFNIPSNNPTTLDIYHCWISTKPNGDWTELVEAFLTEPGMGYSVCGVQPIGSSNPPVVCSYVRSLEANWVFFAQHIGFPLALIKKIQGTHCYNIPAQIQALLRECLIPDCGDERTKVIMSRVKHVVKLPRCTVKQKAGVGVSAPLKSVHEKEYYSAKVLEKSPSVCTLHQKPTRSYGKLPNEGVNGPLQIQERWAHREPVLRKPYVTPRDMPEPLSAPVQCSRTEPLSSMSNGKELLDSSIKGITDLATGFILSGSNLEARTKDGRTPLLLWCEKNKEEMVRLLIFHGSNIATKDNDGNTCLHFKEALKNSNLIRVLVDAFRKSEISVGQPNKNGVTPLVLCCRGGDICYESALLLITHGADIDCSPSCRPLLDATAGGNKRMVDLLLTYGANINQQDKVGSTALIQACLCNHSAIAKALLAIGADVNKADKSGTTALAAAVTKNSFEMVQILIDTGAHVNVSRFVRSDFTEGEVEETPLASACGRGFEDIADLLVRNGAKVNYMCSGQVPPIGYAIICRQYRMVKFMLELSDLNKSIYGLLVPMNIAMNGENYQAARMILDVLGGPQKAMQIAEQNHLLKFVEEIEIFNAIAGDMSFPSYLEPTHVNGDRVKIEETLQRFSQIAMSAVTTNRDCASLVSVATALEAPHVATFFQEYYNKPLRADLLKARFLSRDHGVSPFNFLVQYQLLDSVQFQSHALDFYPDGPDQFYKDLVWAFHEIPGGETLSWDVHDVLQRLFGSGFQLNVQTGTAYQQPEMTRPMGRPERQIYTHPLGRALPLPPRWEGQKTDKPVSENAQPSGISHLLSDVKMPLDSITGGWRAALPRNSTVNLQYPAPPLHGRQSDDGHVPVAPNMHHTPQRDYNLASPTIGIVNLQHHGLPPPGRQANVPIASGMQLQTQYDQGTTPTRHVSPVGHGYTSETTSGPHLIYKPIDQANSTDSVDIVKPPIMQKGLPPSDTVTPVSRTFSKHHSMMPTVQSSQNAATNTGSDETSTHGVSNNSYNEVERSDVSDSEASLLRTRELERNTSSKPVAMVHPEIHSRDPSNSVPHETMLQNRLATSREATSDPQPSQLHEPSLSLPRSRPSKIPVPRKSKHPRQHKDSPTPRVAEDDKTHGDSSPSGVHPLSLKSISEGETVQQVNDSVPVCTNAFTAQSTNMGMEDEANLADEIPFQQKNENGNKELEALQGSTQIWNHPNESYGLIIKDFSEKIISSISVREQGEQFLQLENTILQAIQSQLQTDCETLQNTIACLSSAFASDIAIAQRAVAKLLAEKACISAQLQLLEKTFNSQLPEVNLSVSPKHLTFPLGHPEQPAPGYPQEQPVYPLPLGYPPIQQPLQHPCVLQACSQQGLRGTDVIAHTQLSITQEEQHFTWKGYGFQLKVPRNSLPEGMVDSLLDIKASLSGLFEFPNNSEQISAVYWIHCPHKFVKRLTLDIQHCAAIKNTSQCSQFAIVTTSCRQKTLPYTFKELEGGVFVPYQSFGSISVTHFSGFSCIQKGQHHSGTPTSLNGEPAMMHSPPDDQKILSVPIQYCAELYRIREDSFWKLHFLVIKDLEACSSIIKVKLQESSYNPPMQVFSLETGFDGDEIVVDIGEDGIVLDTYWHLCPIYKPVIKRYTVDTFHTGKRIPGCELSLRWTNTAENPKCLSHKISLIGAKDHQYFRLCLDPGGAAPQTSAKSGQYSPSWSPSTFTQHQSMEPTTRSDGGKNTSQYKRVVEKIDVIVDFLATNVNPQRLADKLKQAGLINEYIEEKVSMTGVTISDKIKSMISAVLSRIQLNVTNYNKFVTVLKQLGALDDLIEYIGGSY